MSRPADRHTPWAPEIQARRDAERLAWAAWVREQRLALGLTQAGLATLLGRGRTLVHEWEAGRALPCAGDRERVRRQVEAARSLVDARESH